MIKGIGIDLGTTNSVLAYVTKDDEVVCVKNAEGKSLRFDLVDRMEQIKTSPQAVGMFLAAGGLIPGEEAPQGGTR